MMKVRKSLGTTWQQGAFALTVTCGLAGVLIVAVLVLSQGASLAYASPEQSSDDLSRMATLSLYEASRAQSISSGDVFTYAIGGDAVGLDPSRVTDGISFLVTRQIYENLVNYEAGGTMPMPGLAESWTVSPDGLTWTFQLRPGLKFHDGTDLDAAAVVYNFQRWWDPAHPYHDGPFEYFEYMFNGFKGDPGCLISSVSAIGTDQVQIVLSGPYSPLPNTLALAPFGIASPIAIQAESLSTNPVGSGPFESVEWIPDDHIRLSGNATYWGDGPYLQRLVFQVIPGSAEQFAGLQSGGVHGTHSPLNSPLVDQAIAHALDKQSIVSSHYNEDAPRGQVATQLLPPSQWGRDDDLVDYAYDPAQALSLLVQAGYPDGVTTTLWVIPVERFYFPNPMDIAVSMQEDLQAVGISTTLVTEYDWPTYLTKIRDGEADLFMLGWGGDDGHPDNFFYPNLCHCYQRYGPRDDVLCDHLEAARREHDFDTLVGMYKWASQRVHDTLPLVPIGHSRTALVFRHNVGGFVPAPIGQESFGQVFLASEGVEVPPDADATLVYTDPQGSPTIIDAPAGAVSETVTLLYAPLDVAEGSPGTFAGHGFVLEAHRDGELLSGFTFEIPVTVTIHYTDADVAGMDEETLGLRYWDGETWSTDGITIVERDIINNRLVVTLAHLSHFAMFTQGEHLVYLPLVLKAQP
jgi:peptide/nickel transport system substrate-binding protein